MTLSLRRTAALALVGPAVLAAGLALLPSSAEASTTAVATSKVNVRARWTTSSARIATLDKGQRVLAVTPPRNGWVGIRFRGGYAFVSARYLTTGRHRPAAPTRINPAGLKVTTNVLNMRTGPSGRYRVVTTLPIGTLLKVNGHQRGGYVEAMSGRRGGWVSMAYLANVQGSPWRAVAPAPRRVRATPARHVAVSSATRGRLALAFAQRQLGEPYRFGATGPRSWDCSGLTQAAWRAAGVSIPRTSQQQFARGGSRISRSQLRPGDLVFFYGPSPHHVGMYVGGGRIINAPRPGKRVEYTSIGTMPYAGAVRP